MSAIAAVCGVGDGEPRVLRLARAACHGRGTVRTWGSGGVAIAATAPVRVQGPNPAPGSVLIAPDIAVAALATIYYQDDLRAALGGSRPHGPADNMQHPASAIALAYRRWGTDLAAHLEGDFAFAVWDRERNRLVAARDFAGGRPLFYAERAGGIEVASSARALRAGLESRHPLDLPVLGGAAAGLSLAHAQDTAFVGIRVLEAGHTLIWEPGSRAALLRHWSPPEWQRPRQSFEEAAEELRDLIFAAVRERLDPDSPTAITLSGGWDSTALFAAARQLVESGDAPAGTVQISISYPEGDPGREDDWIESALRRWGASTRWLDSDDICLFEDLVAKATRRDQPMAHLFEGWNRALYREAAEAGARVAFTGYGGDQLFQVSDVYMADLLRRGRLLALGREWRAKGGGRAQDFARFVLLPLLSDRALGAIGALRGGRRPHRYLERPLPPWMQRGFVRRERLADRDRAFLAKREGSRAEAEWHWYLSNPFFPAVNAWVTGFGIEEGVSVRAPLYDRRIVSFQATRPWTDRSHGPETKRLLRRAMEGLLPSSLLEPRKARTGITSEFARRQMRRDLPALLHHVFAAELRLAELGIVEPGLFHRYASDAFEGRTPEHQLTAFMTLQAELWVRGLDHAGGTPEDAPPVAEAVHG